MRPSVDRLRWGLAAAAVALLLVLAGFLGYGRYRQLKKWQAMLAKLHLHGPHETTNFTYSSSPKDRTSYKVHAARVIEHGDGKWSLYDVAVTLYSKTGNDQDHIYGSDIEYDQKTGVATAVGEVTMDLQLPSSPGKGTKAAAPSGNPDESKDTIQVATSGLVYVHKLGIAATSQAVEFHYAGMQCTSMGADFDPGQSLLHLLANVVLTGKVQDAAFTMHAARADLNRKTNTIALTHPVAQSQGRTVTSGDAVLHLREDGSVKQAEGSGGVTFDEGTRHLSAAAYSGTFGATSLPLTAKLTGNVIASDTAATRPMRAQAREVDTIFDATGAPASIVATGAAHVLFTERKPGSPELPREMSGDRMMATFGRDSEHKGKSHLREVDAIGSAMARGESLAATSGKQQAGLKMTQVAADDLRAIFAEDAAHKPQLRQVFGNGHARLEQDAPLGERQTSSSDALEVTFTQPVAHGAAKTTAQPSLQIASATQVGDVVIHSVPAAKPGAADTASDATAARASYDEATAKLTLAGGASFSQGQTSLTAATISVNQHTEDAEAVGDVMAALTGAPSSKGKPSTTTAQQVTHIAAQHATLLHASQFSEFSGTPSQPARLWQGASQVQAATLLFDQKKKTLLARSLPGEQVHAVFAKEPSGAGSKAAGEVIRVASTTMVYDDIHREADFNGDVAIDGTTAQAQSQRAVVFLSPAPVQAPKPDNANPFGGSVRSIVLSNRVHIEQPGRTGVGEQLVYTAADGTYVLTGAPGKPPRIVDTQQGSITGAKLLFHSVGGTGGDSTIIVSGATPQNKHGRVRTEVEVRGK